MAVELGGGLPLGAVDAAGIGAVLVEEA